MCVDVANCVGSCSECMSNMICRLKMANKQLTKMRDQHLDELAAERQRARLPQELVMRGQQAIYKLEKYGNCEACTRILREVLAWHEQETRNE